MTKRFVAAYLTALTAAMFLAGLSGGNAQIIDDYLADEKYLYAATKQVNQFFRRFNGEEDEKGKRYYPDDKLYRDEKLRRQYIGMLFDNETSGYDDKLKKDFMKDVLSSDNDFLNFHGDDWFAEVHAVFTFNGKETPAVLFLNLEQDGKGHKWVFDQVYFEPFAQMFDIDTAQTNEFLHPMSHEIDFMNLNKAFNNKERIENYTNKTYRPDFLSLFLYEIKKGGIKFKTIREVKFHFFQINNWYFEVSEFNRSGYNKGWLISSLVAVENEQKELLRRYIYMNK